MRRFLACFLAAGALLVTGAAAQTPLMPGVTFDHQVALTPHGPVAYSVITAPPADRAGDDRPGARRQHGHGAAGDRHPARAGRVGKRSRRRDQRRLLHERQQRALGDRDGERCAGTDPDAGALVDRVRRERRDARRTDLVHRHLAGNRAAPPDHRCQPEASREPDDPLHAGLGSHDPDRAERRCRRARAVPCRRDQHRPQGDGRRDPRRLDRDPGRRRRPRRDRHGCGQAPGRGAAGRDGHGSAHAPGWLGLGGLRARRRPAARQGREARLLDERELRRDRPHLAPAARGGRAARRRPRDPGRSRRRAGPDRASG